jgi:hypothetical protein
MAAYDHGGGCACGLYAECLPTCELHPLNRLSSSVASSALMALLRLSKRERLEVLRRLEAMMAELA